MSIPERKDVNFADTWALTDLYGSDAEWHEDFQWNQDYLKFVKGYQGRLGESAQLLYNWLQLGDEMSLIFEHLASTPSAGRTRTPGPPSHRRCALS